MLYDSTVLVDSFFIILLYELYRHPFKRFTFISLLNAQIKSNEKTMKSEVLVPFEDQSYFLHSQHLDENLFQILGKGFVACFIIPLVLVH